MSVHLDERCTKEEGQQDDADPCPLIIKGTFRFLGIDPGPIPFFTNGRDAVSE